MKTRTYIISNFYELKTSKICIIGDYLNKNNLTLYLKN
jgi:hypothetical protein